MLKHILAKPTLNKHMRMTLPLILLAVTLPLISCIGLTSTTGPPTEEGSLRASTPGSLSLPAEPTAQGLTLESMPDLTSTTPSADFQLTDLVISPSEVEPGEPFLITANLTNSGDSADSYTVELKVNEVTKFMKEVSLPAGEAVELRVIGRELAQGTYTINLSGLSEQLMVRELEEPLILNSLEKPLILNSADPDISQQNAQPNSSSCCGGGSSNQGTSGCGCGSGSSRSANQSGCGCG